MRYNFDVKTVIGEMPLEVHFEADYQPGELKEDYQTIKQVIKELPDTFRDLANAGKAFQEITEEMDLFAEEHGDGGQECQCHYPNNHEETAVASKEESVEECSNKKDSLTKKFMGKMFPTEKEKSNKEE